MEDAEVYKEIVPDRYFQHFWDRKKRNDDRNFESLREMHIRRIDEKRLILNHGGNIIQSNYQVIVEKFKINSSQLNQDALSHIQNKFKIKMENYEQHYILIDFLTDFITKYFPNILMCLKNQEVLEIDIKLLFSNKSSLMAVAYSILIQFFQFCISMEKFTTDLIVLPLHIKYFGISKLDSILLFDPNDEEISLESKKEQANFFFILNPENKENLVIRKLDGNSLSFKILSRLFEDVKNINWKSTVKNNIIKILASNVDDLIQIF
jgi:hypothetical protein